jgi:hypothetical protein
MERPLRVDQQRDRVRASHDATRGRRRVASTRTSGRAMGASNSSFGAINIVAGGTGPYAKRSTRWGDYSWAVIDPSANGVWLATEYVRSLSSQTPDRQSNWGTRVVEVAVG